MHAEGQQNDTNIFIYIKVKVDDWDHIVVFKGRGGKVSSI